MRTAQINIQPSRIRSLLFAARQGNVVISHRADHGEPTEQRKILAEITDSCLPIP